MSIRSLTLLVFVTACSWAGATAFDHTQPPALGSGSYRLVVSEEARSLAQLSGEALPAGSLSITDDHLFVFDTNIGKRLTHREGRVDSSGDEIIFTFGDSVQMKGHLLDDGSLDLSGLHFAKRECGSVVGSWHVNKMDARIEFCSDGKFKFKCTGATSEGKFKVEGGVITLTWTAVDGEAVEPDTMHKKLLLDDEGTFWIDNYHYRKE